MLGPFSTAEIHRKGRQKPSKCLTPFHWSWQQSAQPSLLLHCGKSSLLPLTWLVAMAELGDLQSGQGLGPDAVRLVYQGAAGSSSSRQVHTMKTKTNLPKLFIREKSWKKGNFFSLKTKCSSCCFRSCCCHAVSGNTAGAMQKEGGGN